MLGSEEYSKTVVIGIFTIITVSECMLEKNGPSLPLSSRNPGLKSGISTYYLCNLRQIT